MLSKDLGLKEFDLPQGAQIITTVFSAESNWIPDNMDSDKIARPVKIRFGTEEATVKFCINLLAEIYNVATKEHEGKNASPDRLPTVFFEHPDLTNLIEKIYEKSHKPKKK